MLEARANLTQEEIDKMPSHTKFVMGIGDEDENLDEMADIEEGFIADRTGIKRIADTSQRLGVGDNRLDPAEVSVPSHLLCSELTSRSGLGYCST